MEQLLHYVWKHKLFPLRDLTTTNGQEIEVIDPGLHNSDEGPDFLNAKVRIGGRVWAGSVEIHLRSSDWNRHSHDGNPKYANVILHVVGEADCDIPDVNGNPLPQFELQVPESLRGNYEHLLQTDKYPRCHAVVGSLSSLLVHSWLYALQTERFEQKAIRIESILQESGGDWQRTFFITLSRNFGFGINGETFEQWARSIPLLQVGHHRNNLFQVEAFFLGQAGMLTTSNPDVPSDDYRDRLTKEYEFLAHKFELTPISASQWNFLRLRPQNFPHIRLSQLAFLFYRGKLDFSMLLEADTIKKVSQLFETQVSDYWQTHYAFGSESPRSEKHLGKQMAELLLINTVSPILFAYGRKMNNEMLVERAFSFMEQLKAESNAITRMWAECGVEARNASDGQALVQLKREYCDKRECLRCRFGYEFLKQK